MSTNHSEFAPLKLPLSSPTTTTTPASGSSDLTQVQSNGQNPINKSEGTEKSENVDKKDNAEIKDKLALKQILDINQLLLQGNILFTCFVDPHGAGDLGHFVDIANPKKLEQMGINKDQTIVRLIMCIDEHKAMVEKKLQDANMLNCTHVVYFKRNEVEVSSILNLLDQSAGVKQGIQNYIQCFQRYLQTNPKVKASLLKSNLVFNISTRLMKDILKGGKALLDNATCITLGEHGGANDITKQGPKTQQENRSEDITKEMYLDDPENRQMGFSLAHYGVLMEKPQETLPKATWLTRIKDQRFKRVLGNVKIPFTKDEQWEKFHQEALIIPCYFQEGPESFSVIAQAIISSELVQKSQYKEVIFCVNKGNVQFKTFDEQFLGKCGVSSFDYHVLVDNVQKFKAYPTTGNKFKLKMIEGYILSDEDYMCLVRSAQLFHGCSGDKTFETALANGLFPIYQPRQHKLFCITNFLAVIANFFPEVDLEIFNLFPILYERAISKKYSQHNDFSQPKLRDRIAKFLTEELLRRWGEISLFIQTHLNYHDILPIIVAASLCRAKIKELAQTVDKKRDKEESTTNKQPPEKVHPASNSMAKISNVATNTTVVTNTSIATGYQDIKFLEGRLQQLETLLEQRKEFHVARALSNLDKGVKILYLEKKFFNIPQLKRIFKKMGEIKSLSELNIISYPNLPEVWPEFLDMLKNNKSITNLSITFCRLTDKQLKELCKVLIDRKIPMDSLNLAINQITDTGLMHIMDFLIQQKEPISLHLDNNSITDRGLALLSLNLNKTSLESLFLDKNHLNESGLKAFVKALKGNKKMVEFEFAPEDLSVANIIGPLLNEIQVILEANRQLKSPNLKNEVPDFKNNAEITPLCKILGIPDFAKLDVKEYAEGTELHMYVPALNLYLKQIKKKTGEVVQRDAKKGKLYL